MENFDDTITLEVKNRLNDLFGETVNGAAEFMEPRQQDKSPLRDLKSAVLSIDWEITEDVMNDLLEQVDLLKRRYADDRIASLFLQLLGSVGKYVQVNKHKSHPQAFKILNTVFARLEEIVTSPDLKESEKKRYLYAEIIKFKKLKQKIAIERSRPPVEKEPSFEPVAESEPTSSTPPQWEEDDGVAAGPVVQREPARWGEVDTDVVAAEPVLDGMPADGEKEDEGDDIWPAMSPAVAVGDRSAAVPEPSMPAGDPLSAALEEIKQLIRQEFDGLKEELRMLNRNLIRSNILKTKS